MASVLKVLRSVVAGRRPTGRSPGEMYVNEADRQIGFIDTGSNPQDLIPVSYFSTTATYAPGAVVWANGALRVANAAVAAGPFDATKWDTISGLTSLRASFDPRYLVKAAPTAPINPAVGQIWVDTTDQNAPMFWNGTVWVPLERHLADASALMFKMSLSLNVSPTGVKEPADPISGDAFDCIASAIEWVSPKFTCAFITITVAAGNYNERAILVAPQNVGQLVISGAGKTASIHSLGANTFAFFGVQLKLSNLTVQANIPNGNLLQSTDLNLDNVDVRGNSATNDGSVVFCRELMIKDVTVFDGSTVASLNGGALICGNVNVEGLLSVQTPRPDAAIVIRGNINCNTGATISTPGMNKKVKITGFRRDGAIGVTLSNGALWEFSDSGSQIHGQNSGWYSVPGGPLLCQWGLVTTVPAQTEVRVNLLRPFGQEGIKSITVTPLSLGGQPNNVMYSYTVTGVYGDHFNVACRQVTGTGAPVRSTQPFAWTAWGI